MSAPSIVERRAILLAAQAPTPVPEKPRVEIGARYSPTHAIYRDGLTGEYWERNSPMETRAESEIQVALLKNAANENRKNRT